MNSLILNNYFANNLNVCYCHGKNFYWSNLNSYMYNFLEQEWFTLKYNEDFWSFARQFWSSLCALMLNNIFNGFFKRPLPDKTYYDCLVIKLSQSYLKIMYHYMNFSSNNWCLCILSYLSQGSIIHSCIVKYYCCINPENILFMTFSIKPLIQL